MSWRIDMATLSTIADAARDRGLLTRLTDSLQPISDRLWRAALGALCVVALGALFRVAASAQQNPEPQSGVAPPAATAPSPPASVSSPAASWQQSLVARLARLQRYPPRARGVQGVVSVAFSIDRHGNVVSSRIVKGSGSALLDAEALDLIKRAAPFPPPPAEIADSELSFVVPIRFAAGNER
jgi:TonB family protein